MTDDDDTIAQPSGVLRVSDLWPNIEPYLTPRAKAIIKNQRSEVTDDMYGFGRLIVGDITEETYKDFAKRLVTLFDMFDARHAYWRCDRDLYPVVDSCLAVPMAVPLAAVRTRENALGGTMVDALGNCVENAPQRTMFLMYVFVEGLEWGKRPCTDAENVKEEKRIWLNEITKNVILATREGELPTNPKE